MAHNTGMSELFHTLELPWECYQECAEPGRDASEAITRWRQNPEVAAQLDKIGPDDAREFLDDFGAWDSEALADHSDNLDRILWIASGDLREFESVIQNHCSGRVGYGPLTWEMSD